MPAIRLIIPLVVTDRAALDSFANGADDVIAVVEVAGWNSARNLGVGEFDSAPHWRDFAHILQELRFRGDV